MLAHSVLIGLVSLAVWMALAMWVSRKLVRPLQTAMEKQSEYVAAAEHELKTPLSVLTASLAMLRCEGVENKYLHYAEGAVLPFEAVAYEKGVTLTISVEPDIHILGGNTQLERLLGILTDNAIRHTKRGGEVRVSLRTGGCPSAIRASRSLRRIESGFFYKISLIPR